MVSRPTPVEVLSNRMLVVKIKFSWTRSGILVAGRGVAQLEARRVWDAEVGGSSPPTPTMSVPLRAELIYITPIYREGAVRGKRTSISKTQIDLVLVSARYEPETRRLIFARGFGRRGQVWTDIKLFDRASLVEGLKMGQKIVTGRSSTLAGDFEILSPVHLGSEGQLLAGGRSEHAGDDLELPIL